MKKILYLISVLTALSLATSSCDMDLRPVGVIDPEEAVQSIQDIEYLRNGLYLNFKGAVGGYMASLSEIRSDLFHATASFGNNGGSMYFWSFTSNDSEIQSVWGSPYGVIAQINYFIQEATAVDTSVEPWTSADVDKINMYLGEAYFMRAYCHSELVRLFCLDYVGNEQTFGVPYVTTYSPSTHSSTYPKRGTMEEAYTKILEDLNRAAEKITAQGTPGSMYVTQDAITALRARIALAMGNYKEAINQITTTGILDRYPLAADEAEFKAMWVNDSGQEAIMMLHADAANLGSSYDYGYIGYQADRDIYQPTFIPEQWLVDLLKENPADFRFKNHLKWQEIDLASVPYDVYIFYKFPTNPALNGDAVSLNYAHKQKPFRVAELYLILAEAYHKDNDNVKANEALVTLKSKRIPGFSSSVNYGSAVYDEIKKERVRELMGEGFRINDLIRYTRDGGVSELQRKAAQIPASIYLPEIYQGFYRSMSNFRSVFPIPQDELDANPNMKGQQNPGY